jgi:hypothetical protein
LTAESQRRTLPDAIADSAAGMVCNGCYKECLERNEITS